MTTIDYLFWGLGFFCGLGIGLFYFGGLWWTLVHLPHRVRPGIWLAASYLFRVSIALFGFWLIMRKSLVALFFSLAGFILMRIVFSRKIEAGQRGENHAH